jgi:amino acid transporter
MTAPKKAAAAAPAVQSTESAPISGRYDIISTVEYFFIMLLYAIPVIGWIACVIIAIKAENVNRRNFARAVVIYLIIGIVFSIVSVFVFSFAWAYISQLLGIGG